MDDNEYNVMAIRYLLESMGIEADSAFSGPAAIDLVANRQREGKQYACIFMDLEMPYLDGY